MRRALLSFGLTWVGGRAGVCEELEIPMETVKVPGMGYVCKVRECETAEYAADGKRSCVTCDQSRSRDGTNSGSEFCPVELGKCEAGRCVPRTDTDYYEKNFGKKWEGLSTFKAVTVTHYGGATASGGYTGAYDVNAIEVCMEKLHIDGIAAVPPQMYGSDSTVGQAMFKRNNLCYKIVGADGLTRVVAVMDRCGGYVQCSGGSQQPQDITQVFNFPPIDMAPGATVWADANQCVTNPGALIHSGLGQRCWYYTEGSPFTPKACCAGRCGVNHEQVDWCGSNSHPHFDLSTKLMDLICDAGGGGGVNAGSCQVQWVEPVKCPVWPRPGVCCEQSQTCGVDCSPKPGSCGNDANACSACGGKWCGGDTWHDICLADPKDIPDPPPDWTPHPPDPPKPTGYSPGRDPTPPPAEDADTPSTWPGTKAPHSTIAPSASTTTRPATSGATQPGTTGPATTGATTGGAATTSAAGDTTITAAPPTSPGFGPTASPESDESNQRSNVPAIAGAAAGVVAVLGGAAFGASRLRSTPQLDGEFEQGDEGEDADIDEREGIVQQGSDDFA